MSSISINQHKWTFSLALHSAQLLNFPMPLQCHQSKYCLMYAVRASQVLVKSLQSISHEVDMSVLASKQTHSLQSLNQLLSNF